MTYNTGMNNSPGDLYFFALGMASVAQGLLLSFVLILRSQLPKISSTLLSIWIGILTYLAFMVVLDLSGKLFDWTFLIYTHYPTTLLVGPILYLYARSVLWEDFELNPRNAVHLMPGIFGLAIMAPIFSSAGTVKLAHLYDLSFLPERQLHLSFSVIILFSYLILTGKTINLYKRALRNNLSDIDPLKIDWLWHLVFLTGIILLLAILFLVFHSQNLVFYALPTSLFLLIYYVAFKALNQSNIFSILHEQGVSSIESPTEDQAHLQDIPSEKTNEVEACCDVKYSKSGLSKENIQKYSQKLLNLLDSERPCLQPQLRIQDLAKRMGLNSCQMSQVINIGLGKTFYDLINERRVKEAKNRLNDSAFNHLTVLAIAEDVGFNSKSTFNSAFKQHTGTTPSAFRQQAQ